MVPGLWGVGESENSRLIGSSMSNCNDFSDDKPRIDLCLNQAGVIILRKTGVVYQNQTRGTAVMQRCAEGVLVLLTDPFLITKTPVDLYQCSIEAGLKQIDWHRCYAKANLDVACADKIDTLLPSSVCTKLLFECNLKHQSKI